jgi:hypothetical protein
VILEVRRIEGGAGWDLCRWINRINYEICVLHSAAREAPLSWSAAGRLAAILAADVLGYSRVDFRRDLTRDFH